MARLYADENFRYRVVKLLRVRGHDVLTAREAGRAGFGLPDPQVLDDAVAFGRAVLTFNRQHFIKLHCQRPDHEGIIVCTEDPDSARLTDGIETAIASINSLKGQLLRVNLPP